MSSTRINWRELKGRVTIPMLLGHYGWLELMAEADDGSYKGPCPLHSETTKQTGSTSFKVTPSGRGFNCFGCAASGSIIDLVAAREGIEPKRAGRLIDEWFPASAGALTQEKTRPKVTATVEGDSAPDIAREAYRDHVFSGLPVYTSRLKHELSLDVLDYEFCNSPQALYPILRDYYADRDREELVAALFDIGKRLIGLAQLAVGSANACLVEPAQVFKPAILANAATVVLAHNHPSGNPSHSQADLEITRQVRKAGEIIGIPLHDHIIVGRYRYVSLAEAGHFA